MLRAHNTSHISLDHNQTSQVTALCGAFVAVRAHGKHLPPRSPFARVPAHTSVVHPPLARSPAARPQPALPPAAHAPAGRSLVCTCDLASSVMMTSAGLVSTQGRFGVTPCRPMCASPALVPLGTSRGAGRMAAYQSSYTPHLQRQEVVHLGAHLIHTAVQAQTRAGLRAVRRYTSLSCGYPVQLGQHGRREDAIYAPDGGCRCLAAFGRMQRCLLNRL